MRKQFAAVILGTSLTLAGCAARQSKITNLPPGVTQVQVQGWDVATANLNKIAVSVSALRQTVIGLHNTIGVDGKPLFPSGDPYIYTLEAIGKIDQIENTAATFLQGVPKDWSPNTKAQVQSYVNQIAAAVQEINKLGVTNIKNPGSQSQVGNFIKELTSSISIILAL